MRVSEVKQLVNNQVATVTLENPAGINVQPTYVEITYGEGQSYIIATQFFICVKTYDKKETNDGSQPESQGQEATADGTGPATES